MKTSQILIPSLYRLSLLHLICTWFTLYCRFSLYQLLYEMVADPNHKGGSDILVKARLDYIILEVGHATEVVLANGDMIHSKKGIFSDVTCGFSFF